MYTPKKKSYFQISINHEIFRIFNCDKLLSSSSSQRIDGASDTSQTRQYLKILGSSIHPEIMAIDQRRGIIYSPSYSAR